eukprot:TRINITY_DN22539_c0_g1_i1.p1 TRINITY_DN22539_c0_g1~~TRINITY_DN22539_c0_g1_i1.p1  ORF type:complete len:185 (-),score=12.98 TRINITY_DN22539_c0_g1_i1:431-985(-)
MCLGTHLSEKSGHACLREGDWWAEYPGPDGDSWLLLDLGRSRAVCGVQWWAANSEAAPRQVMMQFATSGTCRDDIEWTAATAEHEAPFYPRPRPVEALYFPAPVDARYLRFVVKSRHEGTSEGGEHGYYCGVNHLWVIEDPGYHEERLAANKRRVAWIVASLGIASFGIDHNLRELVLAHIPRR